MSDLKPPDGFGNRIKFVCDGLPMNQNTHGYLVNQEGEILGEIPFTYIRLEVTPAEPTRVTLEVLASLVDAEIPVGANYEELLKLTKKKFEYEE